MGLFHIRSKKKDTGITVYSPVAGVIKPLETLNDGVFSEKLLGEGCAVDPSEEVIIAPFDGVIVMLVESKHAIGIRSDEGVELIIHVGLDTVMMNGDGFETLVKADEKVKKDKH